MKELHLVFEDFPGPGKECVFVEAEDKYGRSVNCGEWRKRDDGYVELVITILPNPDPPEPADDPIAWSGGFAANH